MKFKTKDHIGDKYEVMFPIKQGVYAETYRVKAGAGGRYFLKLFNPMLLSASQMLPDGELREVAILRHLDNKHLPRYADEGTVDAGGCQCPYVVTDFVPSETLAERLNRSKALSVHETKNILRCVLDALSHLHNQPRSILHNEITALNVLIDLATENVGEATLIDFGYARYGDEAFNMRVDGLDWLYLAPEALEGAAVPQSDLYSVGVLAYQMLFGMLPWQCDLSRIAPENRKAYILKLKNAPLLLPKIEKFELDEQLINVLRKAMSAQIEDRLQTAEDFIKAINGQIVLSPTGEISPAEAARGNGRKKGNGFGDVAGMEPLKKMLKDRVISILRDTEKARKYRLQIPNGMLLYGPPGCGKSFLAEKFAEEAGYNFKLVKASDLASIYIHGTQEKIGRLFDEARQNAPTILCFDEFDALVPARGNIGAEHQSGEVNEFLSQLNNCGEHNVFVIASTNRPDMIDSAVLRRGRIDKVIYVPIPDAESRAGIFEIQMRGRPYDSNIDYARLSALTPNYIASDITYIVNEAAAVAAMQDAKISQQMLEDAIKESQPSLTQTVLSQYEQLRTKMEGIVEQRRKVGF